MQLGEAFIQLTLDLPASATQTVQAAATKQGAVAGKAFSDSANKMAKVDGDAAFNGVPAAAKKAGVAAGQDMANAVNAKLRTMTPPDIKLNGDPKPALAAIETVRKAVDGVSGKSGTIALGVDSSKVTSGIAGIKAAIATIKNKITVDVEVDTRDASAKLRDLADDMNNTEQEGRLLRGAMAALGPAIVPAMAVGVGAVAGLGAAVGAAGLSLGLFGAAVGTVFTQFKSQQEKVDTLKGKIAALDQEIAKNQQLGLSTNKLDAEKAKLLEKLNAEYAKLPEGSRAAFDAFEKLKGSWQDFIKANGAQVYGVMKRVFDTLVTALGKLQPMMDVGAKAADALSKKFESFVNGGGLDKVVKYISTTAGPAMNNLGGVLKNLGTFLVNVFKNFAPTGQGFLKWLNEATAKLASWSAGNGMTKFVEYISSNGGKVASVLADMAKALMSIATAVSPLAPISLAVAQALAKIIQAIPQPVLTALVASFVAYRVAVAATTAVAKTAAVASALWAGIQGKNTTANATNTASIVANRVALVAHAVATKASAVATAALNAVMRANPIGIVVTAIAALVAGLVLLYKNNETVRKAIDAAWAAIKKAMAAVADWWVKTAWPALKKAWEEIKPVIEAVGTAIKVAWDKVKALFTSNEFLAVAKTAFENFKTTLVGIWQVISGAVKTAWAVISGIFNTIKAVLSGDFKGAWEALKTMIAGVWDGIKTIITGAWNILKSTVFGQMLAFLGGAFKQAWQGLTSFFTSVWNGIKAAISTAWQGILGILNPAVNFIKSTFGPVFTWLKDNIVKPVWDGIKLAIQLAWVAIQIIFKTFEIAIKALGLLMSWLWNNAVKPAWEGIKTAISAAWTFIKTTVLDAWQTYIKGPFTAMWNAFKTFFTVLWTGLKTFLTTTWNAIKTTIFDAWQTYIKGPFTAMWNGFKAFFTLLWNTLKTFLVTTWTAIKTAVFDVWSNYIKGPFTAMWNAFKAAFTVLWTAIKTMLVTTWSAIKTTVFDVWSNYIKGPFTAMWNAFKAFITTLWNAIKTMLLTVWNWIKANVFDKIVAGLTWLKDKWALWQTAVAIVWNQWKDKIKQGWDWVKSNVFEPIKTFITSTIPNAFQTGVSAIGKAWDKLRDVVKKPVQFVVNTVIRDGIVRGFNAIASKVGVGTISFNGMADGGVIGTPGTRQFAHGGVMPGYTPGRDVHRFVGPAGTLDLSGGEAVMRPEFTRVIGPKAVHTLNRAARTGGVTGVKNALGLARGGIIGPHQSFQNGGVVDTVSSWWEALSGMAKTAAATIGDMVGKVSGSGATGWLGSLLKGVVSTLMTGVRRTVMGAHLGGGNAGQTKEFGNVGAGTGYQWQIGVLRAAGLNPRITSTTGGGHAANSWHYKGRAIDIGNESMTIFNWIKKNYGARTLELIYGPAGGGNIWHGKPHNYGAGTLAAHYNHIHWAIKNGGLFKYDDGGWLEPGMAGINRGRKPEAVLTPAESQGLKSMGTDQLIDKLDELIDAVERVAPGVGGYLRGAGNGLRAAGRSV